MFSILNDSKLIVEYVLNVVDIVSKVAVEKTLYFLKKGMAKCVEKLNF